MIWRRPDAEMRSVARAEEEPMSEKKVKIPRWSATLVLLLLLLGGVFWSLFEMVKHGIVAPVGF